MLAAMFDVAAERGAANVIVAHVVERSGVSRRTFYEHFEDREDCLLAAFERALTIASEDVLPAYDAAKSWRERIRAGLSALLAFCDREPSIARMLLCESAASGPTVAQRRAQILASLTRIVDQGRTLTGTGKQGKAQNVSTLAAEGIVGGVLSVIQARLLEEEHTLEEQHTNRAHTQRASGGGSLIDLTNELMSMIVLPYMGAAGARRELERPAPTLIGGKPECEPLRSDPFKEAGMRLTYRTVRVLMAIAGHPQASNRQIGTSAGIADQGQISKLLARLERIGLVTNTGIHPGKGAPNSWTLTEKGEPIAQRIRTHTDQTHGASER
jgi:AcrR family transcriptional regulator/DNA-binding MarR family transcriptional regulator